MFAKIFQLWLLLLLFIATLAINLLITTEQQFVYLAQAFFKGSLSFIKLPPTTADLSYFNGQYYWPLGPFPAVLLMPFVLIFDLGTRQGFLQFILNIVNFMLIIKISQSLKLTWRKSLWLAVFYIFGSVYSPVGSIPSSWYFAQVIATTCLLFALYEFFNQKRWLIIGIAIALAAATRLSLILSAVFFLPFVLKKPLKLTNLATFFLPIILTLILISAYNFNRFGNILEGGYRYQLVPQESAQRRNAGLFSVSHIPANLYYMLIKTPDPVLKDQSHVLKPPYLKFDNYGMSLFFLSPILFLIFKAQFKNLLVGLSSLTILALFLPIVTYYGIGFRQVGYRYALDFYPFLLIVLISAVKKTNFNLVKILIGIGVAITWFFIFEKLSGF